MNGEEMRGPDGQLDPHLTDEEVERQLDLAEADRCHLCGAGDTTGCECSRPRSVTITVQMVTEAFTDADIPDTQQRAELATTLRRLANTIQRGRGPLTNEVVVDSNTMPVGQLDVHTGEPLPFEQPVRVVSGEGEVVELDAVTLERKQPSVENIASFLALMQGGGGLFPKAPNYIAEKFARLLADEGQALDPSRRSTLDGWRAKWKAYL